MDTNFGSGSSDLYQTTGKRPYASINTSEDDGFLDAPKFFASSSPFDPGPRSLGVFGLHEGTDAQARADAWQTAEAAT